MGLPEADATGTTIAAPMYTFAVSRNFMVWHRSAGLRTHKGPVRQNGFPQISVWHKPARLKRGEDHICPLGRRIDRHEYATTGCLAERNPALAGREDGVILPMPTFSPGCHLVPRWRIMILPGITASPPNFFTPRRRPSESRPLRELPPAFL